MMMTQAALRVAAAERVARVLGDAPEGEPARRYFAQPLVDAMHAARAATPKPKAALRNGHSSGAGAGAGAGAAGMAWEEGGEEGAHDDDDDDEEEDE